MRLPSLLAAWSTECLDALYPPLCALCGTATEGGAACDEHALPAGVEGPRCRRCAVRLSDALPDSYLCARCRRDPPSFASVVALGDYHARSSLRDWVLALKHGGRAGLAAPLGAALGNAFARAGGPAGALFVPVPLHPLRRLERGYDQAFLLARGAALSAGGVVRRHLRRTRWTPPQGASGARSRRANVRDAFLTRRAARASLGGRPVWLVDDVLTSGATASACARALRAAGAGEVTVLCVALVEERRPAGDGASADDPPPPRRG